MERLGLLQMGEMELFICKLKKNYLKVLNFGV